MDPMSPRPTPPVVPPGPSWGSPPPPPPVVPPGPSWGSPPPPPAPVPPVPPTADAPRRARRRLGPLVLATLVVVALVGAGLAVWATTRDDGGPDADDWVTAETGSGRFEVDLPGTAERLADTFDAAGRTLDVSLLRLGDPTLDRIEPGTLFLEVDLTTAPDIAAMGADPTLGPTLLYAQAQAVFTGAGMQLDPQQAPGPGIDRTDLGPAIALSGSVPGRDLVARGWAVAAEGAVLAALVISPADEAATSDRVLARIVGSVVQSS